MSEIVDIAVPHLLQSIQRQIGELSAVMEARFDRVDERFAHVDEILREQCRDTAGFRTMAKSLSGNFAGELATVEDGSAALESRDVAR